MARRAAPHRGIDVHYGSADDERASDGEGEDGHPGRPSKTRAKQHAHEMQALGEALAALGSERLAAIEMPEPLRDAILELRRTRSFEGQRRQLQYVGKLMRSADEAALREAVAAATVGSAKETLALHETERWRAELIASDDALTRWQQAYPQTDTQQLRSLVRAARRDAAPGGVPLPPQARQPRSHRELFQFIKPLLQPQATPDDEPDADPAPRRPV
jgi:ribosome-associated protein